MRKDEPMLKHRVRRIEALRKRCGDDRPRGPAQPPPRLLQTPQDLIDLLEEQVEALRAAAWAGAPEVRRAAARDVLEIGLKLRQQADFEQRLQTLEERLETGL